MKNFLQYRHEKSEIKEIVLIKCGVKLLLEEKRKIMTEENNLKVSPWRMN